jgi:hypothetical protein
MNERDVAIGSGSDAALSARLQEALRAVPGVNVEGVTNGQVTLGGVVPSREIAADIAAIAAGVEGVSSVNADRVAIAVDDRERADDKSPQIDPRALEEREIVKDP